MTRVYFELGGYDRYHRIAWEERLNELGRFAAPEVVLVGRAVDADLTVETFGWHSFSGGRVFSVAPASNYHARPNSTFAWDAGDLPTGRLPGLYCSLSRRLLDPGRHRSFCYLLRHNTHVGEFPLEDARHLFGFTGALSAPIRHRLFETLRPYAAGGMADLQAVPSIWGKMFGTEADTAKHAYAESLRRCRFVLCPRGNGLSSVRLFETMEAARVPVILSDDLVLPECVDWSSCAIIVPENRLADIPRLLSSRESDWPALALRARRAWEENFSSAQLLRRAVSELNAIKAARSVPENTRRFPVMARIAPTFALRFAKNAFRFCQTSLRRHRSSRP